MRSLIGFALSCALAAGTAAASAPAASAPPAPPTAPPIAPSAPAAPAAPVAPAATDSSAQLDRLGDAVVAMLPIGEVFDAAAAADPTWPLQKAVDKVTPVQLACARTELSSPGYRRSMRALLEPYVAQHPSHVPADLKVLDAGASFVFGQLIRAGVEKARTHDQTPVDPAKALAGVTSEQVAAFITFTSDPEFSDLRQVIGLGDALSVGKSQDQAGSRGEQVGAVITSRLMIKAMGTCDVPPAVYLF
jgi:hypothetical protein